MGARSSHVVVEATSQQSVEEEEEVPVQPEDRFQLSDRDRAGCLVVVDVSGESNEWLLVGKQLSIELDSTSSRIRYVFSHGKGRWPLDRLVTWRHLGRVPLPPDLFAASCHPDIWSTKLDMLASELYTQMLKELGRRDWPHEPSLMFAERLAALLLQQSEELETLPHEESPPCQEKG